jgi:hypothetical protein
MVRDGLHRPGRKIVSGGPHAMAGVRRRMAEDGRRYFTFPIS